MFPGNYLPSPADRWLLEKPHNEGIKFGKAATAAEEHFTKVVQRKEVPKEIPTVSTAEVQIRRVLKSCGLVASISEATRQLNQRAVKMDGKIVTDPKTPVQDGQTIQCGKLKWCKIKLVPPTIPSVTD